MFITSESIRSLHFPPAFPSSNKDTHSWMPQQISLFFFLLLFLFLVFLLETPLTQKLFPLLSHKLSVALVTRMVPRGLTIGKVEVVDISSDVLAAGGQRKQEAVCSQRLESNPAFPVDAL